MTNDTGRCEACGYIPYDLSFHNTCHEYLDTFANVRAEAMKRMADRLEFDGDLELAAYCRREAESLLLEAKIEEETER